MILPFSKLVLLMEKEPGGACTGLQDVDTDRLLEIVMYAGSTPSSG